MSQPMSRSAAFTGAVDLSALRARAESTGPANAGPTPSSSDSPNVIDVSEASFQADVVERSMTALVVLDLWAEWCGPCKQLSPVLERLAAEGGGTWVLAKIDIDANPRIAQALQVRGIPAVIAVFQGAPIDAFAGALPEPEVRNWLGGVMAKIGGQLPAGADQEAEPEPEDPRLTAAEEAIERGDYADAARRYRDILAAEPAHPMAGVALAHVELRMRVDAGPADPIGAAEARPDDVDAQLAAADAQLATGDPAGGFARLVDLVRRTAGDDRDRARSRLVELFSLFADDDPTVAAARRALANALF